MPDGIQEGIQSGAGILGRKLGPFAVWQWAVVGTGTVAVWQLTRKRKQEPAAQPQPIGLNTLGYAPQNMAAFDRIDQNLAAILEAIENSIDVNEPTPEEPLGVNLSILRYNLKTLASLPQFASHKAQLESYENYIVQIESGFKEADKSLIDQILALLAIFGVSPNTIYTPPAPPQPETPPATPPPANPPPATPPPAAPPPGAAPPPAAPPPGAAPPGAPTALTKPRFITPGSGITPRTGDIVFSPGFGIYMPYVWESSMQFREWNPRGEPVFSLTQMLSPSSGISTLAARLRAENPTASAETINSYLNMVSPVLYRGYTVDYDNPSVPNFSGFLSFFSNPTNTLQSSLMAETTPWGTQYLAG